MDAVGPPANELPNIGRGPRIAPASAPHRTIVRHRQAERDQAVEQPLSRKIQIKAQGLDSEPGRDHSSKDVVKRGSGRRDRCGEYRRPCWRGGFLT